MKTKIISCCYDCGHTELVTVESSFTRGFGGIQLIGNASDVCRDGKERAKTSLETIGCRIPDKRILINLTPADVRKDSNHFDLPIALSVFLLLHEAVTTIQDPHRYLFAAELGLSGDLRPVKGIISFTITALKEGFKGIVVSSANLRELATIRTLGLIKDHQFAILGFESLGEIVEWLLRDQMPSPSEKNLSNRDDDNQDEPVTATFNDMFLSREQEKIAMCVGAGLHSLLMRGTPGTGKSMFAQRLPSILPNMPAHEHLQALQITSFLTPKIPTPLLHGIPPFRSPHHGASSAAVLGNTERPGELSLAHGGILFLDEFPEFRRDLVEALREPLETGMVHVARANKKVNWHSRVTLVAACNNCPCGWYGSRKQRCHCPPPRVQEYRNRLSGPILDRIDIHFNIPEVADPLAQMMQQFNDLGQGKDNTKHLKQQIMAARSFALERNRAFGIKYNCEIRSSDILAASSLKESQLGHFLAQTTKKRLTPRSLVRCLRVARTLADLDQSLAIREEDIQQAVAWSYDYAALECGSQPYGRALIGRYPQTNIPSP